MTSPLQGLLLCLLLLSTFTALAENSTKANGYTVHHNAIPTAMLTPEIASQYRIVRSKYRGLLNVAIIRDQTGTTGQPVSARVRAVVANLAGVMQEIRLRQINEGDAIYYIGECPIVNGETLRFSIEVTPNGTRQLIKAQLSQDFYID